MSPSGTLPSANLVRSARGTRNFSSVSTAMNIRHANNRNWPPFHLQDSTEGYAAPFSVIPALSQLKNGNRKTFLNEVEFHFLARLSHDGCALNVSGCARGCGQSLA